MATLQFRMIKPVIPLLDLILIYVEMRSNTKAVGDRPRNFEPWSWLSFEEHNSYKLFIFTMSGRKESRTGNVRPGRNKKRKFSGKRFTTQKNTELIKGVF
ncbi:hypothetical protein TNCV_1535851 [Trichonephila clavipes]|nr:hypothetical protein TNCV_1535851 [Trichonephila clavipes]